MGIEELIKRVEELDSKSDCGPHIAPDEVDSYLERKSKGLLRKLFRVKPPQLYLVIKWEDWQALKKELREKQVLRER